MKRPRLGVQRYEALGRCVAVIGAAKSRFVKAEPVLRGRSRSPLYVTAVGMDVAQAARHVRSMHGPHQIPTLLNRVDQLSRG